MNSVKFNKLVSTETSGWLEEAKRRRKYRRIRNIVFWFRVKFLGLKRKIKKYGFKI